MRFACDDMRDHILSYQNDHRPSYWRRRALRQQERLRIDFREILRVVRFSTFATISAPFGPVGLVGQCPLLREDRKSRFGAVKTVFDPLRTSARAFQYPSLTRYDGFLLTLGEQHEAAGIHYIDRRRGCFTARGAGARAGSYLSPRPNDALAQNLYSPYHSFF